MSRGSGVSSTTRVRTSNPDHPATAVSSFVLRYEAGLARALGVEHVISFGYARHGLTSIFTAAGLRPGDEVVLSPLTCRVVPLALLSLGLRPVYADISADSLNLDAAAVQAALTTRTGAVLFQHTYGNPAGVQEVAAVARARGLLLVEDCAQCLPMRSGGYRPGHAGDAAVFSNNLMKPLPAGSGGVVSTSDERLVAALRAIQERAPARSAAQEWLNRAEHLAHRWMFRPWLYWPAFEVMRRVGATYRTRDVDTEIASDVTARMARVSDWQARQGLATLAALDRVSASRRAACAHYSRALRSCSTLALPCLDTTAPLYYFPALVADKAALLAAARRRLVQVVAWPMGTLIYPVEDEATLPQYGYRLGSCPTAEDVARRLVGLPTDPGITPRHRNRLTSLIQTLHQERAQAHD